MANSVILRHGWQPKSTFRHAVDTEVVPNWYSLFDHLREVPSKYVYIGVDLNALYREKLRRKRHGGCAQSGLRKHHELAAELRSGHRKKCYDRRTAMPDITKAIQSLTTFRRRPGDLTKQLRKNNRSVAHTLKGRAAAVVQDAEAYQRLLDRVARADVEEGIRQGLEDSREGKVRLAEEFFDEFEMQYGPPREPHRTS